MKGLDEIVRAYKERTHNQTIEKFSCEDIDNFTKSINDRVLTIISNCKRIDGFEEERAVINHFAYEIRNNVNQFCELYFGINNNEF